MKKYLSNTFVLIALVAILGGTGGVMIKYILRVIPPFSYSFIRFFLAFLTLSPLYINHKKELKSLGMKVFWVTLFGVGNIVFYLLGIRLTAAIPAQVLYAFVPVLVAILSYFILHERFSAKKTLGIIIGLAGVLGIIFAPQFMGRTVNTGTFEGNILVFAAIVCFSLFSVLLKSLHKKHTPVALNFAFITMALISQGILALWEVTQPGFVFHMPSVPVIIAILYTGTLSTAVFYLLHQYLIKHSSPVVASTFQYLNPVVAISTAMLLLGEQLTPIVIGGTILIFTGVWFVNTAKVVVIEPETP